MSFSDEEHIEELEKEVQATREVMEQQAFRILELQREVSKLEKVIITLVQDNLLKGTN